MPKPSFYSPYSNLLETLKQELPLCFKRTGFKQPLKIDIHKDVLAHYAQDKRFTPKRLCKAISLYTKGKAYVN
jgi:sRNA-binding protein